MKNKIIIKMFVYTFFVQTFLATAAQQDPNIQDLLNAVAEIQTTHNTKISEILKRIESLGTTRYTPAVLEQEPPTRGPRTLQSPAESLEHRTPQRADRHVTFQLPPNSQPRRRTVVYIPRSTRAEQPASSTITNDYLDEWVDDGL